MFEGQPKGLYALALANTGERFGYYTMLAIFLLFIQAKFGFSAAVATQIYSIFLAAVYFMPLFGGILADKIGFGKCVTLGIGVMFAGYLCLAIPTEAGIAGKVLMFGALALIAIGTGLFKGNLQVMVGNLYDDPKYSSKRDAAFSLFYMAINIGAMFAPSMAKSITNFFLEKGGLFYDANIPSLAHQCLDGVISPDNADKLSALAASMDGAAGMDLPAFSSYYIERLSEAYNYGFAVACVSLLLSVAIYYGCRSWFKHADVNSKQAQANHIEEVELTPAQTKSRITALLLVFAVVVFFWMDDDHLCPRLYVEHCRRVYPHRFQRMGTGAHSHFHLYAVQYLPGQGGTYKGYSGRGHVGPVVRCRRHLHVVAGRGAYPAVRLPAV